MRKSIIAQESREVISPDLDWLYLPAIARVELTSEEASHPIESALDPKGESAWRASEPGPQAIRLLFDEPRRIRRIHLVFHEAERQRTQQFVLRWSPDEGRSYREIMRQQYNFSPPDASREIEDYVVDLSGVTVLELVIVPEMSGGDARASLARLLLA
jgi:hypothetical protein